VCAACGAAALFLRTPRERLLAGLALLSIMATFMAMATRPRVFPFYYQPAFFPAAVLVGWGLQRILEPVGNWVTTRKFGGIDLRTAVPFAFALMLLTILRSPTAAMVSPRRAEQIATYRQTYSWVDGPGIGWMNPVFRSLFWQEGERIPSRNPNAMTEYLWQRSRYDDVHGEIIDAVLSEAKRRPSTMLFGDSTIAPMVAFEAGVRIPGDLVDTNTQRLRTGDLAIGEVTALLDAHPETLVLVAKGGGIGSAPELRDHLARHFELARTFESRMGGQYQLYRRRT